MSHACLGLWKRRGALLYALLDTGLVEPRRAVGFGLELAAAGVDLIQLRGKGLESSVMLSIAQGLLPTLRDRRIPLVVNDRVDVALAAGADGVHLGQDDLPADEARRLLGPDKLLGWSTHSHAEVCATPAAADYLGFGAMFATSTRRGSWIAGPRALPEALAATTLPTFAIGGIDAENAMELGTYGLAGIAVAAALVQGHSREDDVRALRRALDRWPSSETRSPS